MTAHHDAARIPQPRGHNLFLALKPPSAVAGEIGALRDRLGGAKPMGDDRLHLTLRMLHRGKAPPPTEMKDALCDAMTALTAEAFELSFDRFGANGETVALFPHQGRSGLRRLRRQIDLLIGRAGLSGGGHPKFNPHMTLFYAPAAVGRERIAPIGWHADEIVLIHSLVGLAKHVLLARWPLIAQLRLL
jgi:2'-5' RNA ligase